MDVNGLRSFGLPYGPGGLLPRSVPVGDDKRAITVEAALHHRVTGVRLASRSHGLELREEPTNIADVLLGPSMAVDALGNFVRWDGTGLTSTSHLAATHALAPRSFPLPAAARPVTDITVGDDDVLYVAGNEALWLVDLRARFELTRVDAPAGFKLQRLASAPGGGVFALDVEQGAMARASGLPLPASPLYVGRKGDPRFEAQDPNPDPPKWRVFVDRIPATERAVAIATHRHGRVLVLCVSRAPGGGASIRVLLDDGRLSLPLQIEQPRFPHTLGWLDAERIAVASRGMLKASDGGRRDPGVWAFAMPAALLDRLVAASGKGEVTLPKDLAYVMQSLGDYYPLADWTGGSFVAGRPGERLHYPRRGRDGIEPAKVARVATAARSRYGAVVNAAEDTTAGASVVVGTSLVDSRDRSTVWHRLYAEAIVPPGCAMIVWLAAGDGGPPHFVAREPKKHASWFPHVIGERSALPQDVQDALPPDTPRAAWVKEATEVAHGQSVLCASLADDLGQPSVAGRAGLFAVLIQRADTAVRALQGSRLWIAVELFGDGRATPELAVLRAYAGRVSYRDRYLPALYHERAFGADAQRPGRATGPDFLERYLHLFEGLFTDIEGRIAASALMTDAMACPADALPWLGAWIGMSIEPGMPTERARWMLVNAPQLARRHGTLSGLQLALDIATDGGVTCGRIVVVEDFRLRRTLSTILGAHLEDATDPLTTGITQSGNSVIGDSLFLGEANALQDDELKTFLALFRRIDADTPESAATLQRERAGAHKALFDDLSHRVTVLVHEEFAPDELRMIQRLCDLGAPAHVLMRVVKARYPFMVGVASLVGADTFLRASPPKRPVRMGPGIETSSLGGVDTLRGEASLDAHAGAFNGVLYQRPVARAELTNLPADGKVREDTPFTIDGSASTADEGRIVETYNWLLRPSR